MRKELPQLAVMLWGAILPHFPDRPTSKPLLGSRSVLTTSSKKGRCSGGV
jgi:hypothetical protein